GDRGEVRRVSWRRIDSKSSPLASRLASGDVVFTPPLRCGWQKSPRTVRIERRSQGGESHVKIILANPRGFCAGVNMAIESLDRALELYGTPLYVYHEIVHNRPVVERFRKRGVVFVDAIAEIPSGATVLYRAHGLAPAIRSAAAKRDLRAIDATCPLVTKVHLEAVRFAKDG